MDRELLPHDSCLKADYVNKISDSATFYLYVKTSLVSDQSHHSSMISFLPKALQAKVGPMFPVPTVSDIFSSTSSHDQPAELSASSDEDKETLQTRFGDWNRPVSKWTYMMENIFLATFVVRVSPKNHRFVKQNSFRETYILKVEFHYDNVQDRGHLSTEARVRSVGTTTWFHKGEFFEKLIVAQSVD
jgi:hypothetical protein